MKYFAASLAGLFLCAGAAVTSPVWADAPVGHPYQVRALATSGNCQGGSCSITFPAIATAGNTLVLEVSCGFSSPGNVTGVILTNPGFTLIQHLPAINQGTVGGTISWNATGPTYMFFAKGQQPVVDVFTVGGAVSQLDCTLAGYY